MKPESLVVTNVTFSGGNGMNWENFEKNNKIAMTNNMSLAPLDKKLSIQ